LKLAKYSTHLSKWLTAKKEDGVGADADAGSVIRQLSDQRGLVQERGDATRLHRHQVAADTVDDRLEDDETGEHGGHRP